MFIKLGILRTVILRHLKYLRQPSKIVSFIIEKNYFVAMDIFLTAMLKIVENNPMWLLCTLNIADQGTDFASLFNLN